MRRDPIGLIVYLLALVILVALVLAVLDRI